MGKNWNNIAVNLTPTEKAHVDKVCKQFDISKRQLLLLISGYKICCKNKETIQELNLVESKFNFTKITDILQK